MKKNPLCLEKTVMVNQLAYMQERTLPPPPKKTKQQKTTKNQKHITKQKKSTKINRFKTLGIYTELNHPLLRDILCSATEKWTMAMGRIIREEPIFFFVINVWYSVRFLAEFIALSILRDIFFFIIVLFKVSYWDKNVFLHYLHA